MTNLAGVRGCFGVIVMIGEILTSQFEKKRSNMYFHQKHFPQLMHKALLKSAVS